MRNIKVAQDTSDSSASDDERPPPTAPPIAVAVPIFEEDELSRVVLPTPSAPPVEGIATAIEDEEAQALATAAQQQGITTIRNHCVHHLAHNPDSSYVTWIATLHPENATVVIDSRFMIDGNPWLVVYEQVKDDLHKGRVGAVTSVPQAPPGGGAPPLAEDGNEDGDSDESEAKETKWGGGGLLDFIIGCSLVLSSVAASFAIELVASYCYFSYRLCDKIANTCSPPGVFTCLPFLIAYFLGKVFQLVDASLLLVSIIVVEVMATCNYFLCTVLACSRGRGREMHQLTRKFPHLVRWAFRKRRRTPGSASETESSPAVR